MPTPVYQVTPYPSVVESTTSTHTVTEGALYYGTMCGLLLYGYDSR